MLGCWAPGCWAWVLRSLAGGPAWEAQSGPAGASTHLVCIMQEQIFCDYAWLYCHDAHMNCRHLLASMAYELELYHGLREGGLQALHDTMHILCW